MYEVDESGRKRESPEVYAAMREGNGLNSAESDLSSEGKDEATLDEGGRQTRVRETNRRLDICGKVKE